MRPKVNRGKPCGVSALSHLFHQPEYGDSAAEKKQECHDTVSQRMETDNGIQKRLNGALSNRSIPGCGIRMRKAREELSYGLVADRKPTQSVSHEEMIWAAKEDKDFRQPD
jgi:hypothetical protein